uniref:Splicing regulator RBM11 n=1 Tax=Myotis myotis TaxID=51298 RepID=A0A7J7VI57_MYOMY|nr:hypothetical protein mMyoMyo1_008346 [Myotis myotis]
MFPAQEEADRTVFVGNLEARVREEILYELFLQAGPLTKVTICKDREGKPKSFGFVCFKHPESVSYAIALLNGIRLYGRLINVQYRFGRFIQGVLALLNQLIKVLRAVLRSIHTATEMKKPWAVLSFPCSSFQLIMQLYLKNIFSFRRCSGMHVIQRCSFHTVR